MHVNKKQAAEIAPTPLLAAEASGSFQFADTREAHQRQADLQAKANEVTAGSKVAQLQKIANGNEPIQRKIHLTSGVFSGDASRPGWRKFLKDFVVAEYNSTHLSSPIAVTAKLDTLNLDRCHRVSFANIQDWLVKYLNGQMTKAKFTEKTDTLYRSSSTDKAGMAADRALLFAATTNAKKLAYARSLLSYLNSATGNVGLGEDSLNRSLQDHLDLHFDKKPGGKYSATPQSRKMMSKLNKGDTSGIPFTPTGKHVKSSHNAEEIDQTKFTPKTDKLIKKHTKP